MIHYYYATTTNPNGWGWKKHFFLRVYDSGDFEYFLLNVVDRYAFGEQFAWRGGYKFKESEWNIIKDLGNCSLINLIS